ncbi:MAG: DNA alkylation repair protein [Chitinophagaceae bacterium]|nr:DNA alkylation repair protein [Chitinophagaceae bacterium]
MKSGTALLNNMSKELDEIRKVLEAHSTKEGLDAALYFLPGKVKQNIYGVRTPVLNQLARQYLHGGFPLVKELWKAGSLEEKILAGKMLGHIAKKDPSLSIRLVGSFSMQIKNWAECDCLGMQSLKPVVKTHHKEIFALARKLNGAVNFWQRRLSLVLVEWYTRDKVFHPQINQLVKALEDDEEYYVKKAIVWIKKNFKKGK